MVLVLFKLTGFGLLELQQLATIPGECFMEDMSVVIRKRRARRFLTLLVSNELFYLFGHIANVNFIEQKT